MTRLAPALPAKRAVPRDGPHGAHHEPVVPRLDDPRLARLQAGIDDDTRERRLADELIHHHVDGEVRGPVGPDHRAHAIGLDVNAEHDRVRKRVGEAQIAVAVLDGAVAPEFAPRRRLSEGAGRLPAPAPRRDRRVR